MDSDIVGPKHAVAATSGGPVTRAQFLNLYAAVFLPMFIAAVDQTLLATATPAIAASLGGLRDSSWIAVAYLLAAATIVPVYGRLGDARGRRNMLLVAQEREEARLAGAVGADQADFLAGIQREVGAFEQDLDAAPERYL